MVILRHTGNGGRGGNGGSCPGGGKRITIMETYKLI